MIFFCESSLNKITLLLPECGSLPDLHYWGLGFFRRDRTVLTGHCDTYSNYYGKISVKCTPNGSWTLDGECFQYGM